MKDKDNSIFITQVLGILDSLHINSQYEVILLDSLDHHYYQKIKEVAILKSTKEALTKEEGRLHLMKTKEEKLEKAISEELNLLNHELSLYQESLNNLRIQILSVEKELDKLNPQAKEKILILRRTLLNLEDSFKKQQKKLEQKKKELIRVKQQKASITSLIKLQKKQKKAISSAQKLDANPLASFLLPGKWLEDYKNSLVTDIAKLKEEIKTTEKIINSFQKSEPIKKIVDRNTSVVAQSEKNIHTERKKDPQPDLQKSTTNLKSEQSKSPQASLLKNFSALFKNPQRQSKAPMSPSTTPTTKITQSQPKTQNTIMLKK